MTSLEKHAIRQVISILHGLQSDLNNEDNNSTVTLERRKKTIERATDWLYALVADED